MALVRGRQPFEEHWLRNTGTERDVQLADTVVPVQVLPDDGETDTFAASIDIASTAIPARPAVATLWAGNRECIVRSVGVSMAGIAPQAGGVMRAWAFTAPRFYRFAFANGVQLAGPGLGTVYKSPIHDRIRQSQALIVGGNPWVPADDPPFPALIGESATGHPVVVTTLGPIALRGSMIDMRDGVGISGPGTLRTHDLLHGPLRLRRFDALCVVTEQPTLGSTYQVRLTANFVWSEIAVPAFAPTRAGFFGAS